MYVHTNRIMRAIQTRTYGRSWACWRKLSGCGVGSQKKANCLSNGMPVVAIGVAGRHIGTTAASAAASPSPAANTGNSLAHPGAAEQNHTQTGGDTTDTHIDAETKRDATRKAIIQEILSRDKLIFELKRQHELSMLRVEQNQGRVLKDQEDRGLYYEQNSNVHTFDTISVGLYSQRSTLYHTMSVERLRNLKIFLTVFTTMLTCVYLYYRYIINPDWAYVERPINMLGSRLLAVREQRWMHLSEAERLKELRREEKARASQAPNGPPSG